MTKAYLSMAAMAAFAAVTTACSSDDDAIQVANTKTLSMVAHTNETEGDFDTAAKAKPSRINSYFNADNDAYSLWDGDDVVWAYSPAENAWNKMTATGTAGNKWMPFACDNAKYDDGEIMVLVYNGDNSFTPSTGSITLNRPESDNDLAIVYGSSSATTHYSDKGNPFSIKRAGASVESGVLQSTDNQLVMINGMAKLRISLPAASAEEAAEMAKLQYQITVELSGNTGRGTSNQFADKYPSSVVYTLRNADGLNSASEVYDVFSASKKNWGDKLKINIKPGTDNKLNSSLLWNTSNSEAVDYLKGYILVPIPDANYTGVTVKVYVTNPNNETLSTTASSLVGKVWKYTKTLQTATNISLSSSTTINKVYGLDAMWDTTRN